MDTYEASPISQELSAQGLDRNLRLSTNNFLELTIAPIDGQQDDQLSKSEFNPFSNDNSFIMDRTRSFKYITPEAMEKALENNRKLEEENQTLQTELNSVKQQLLETAHEKDEMKFQLKNLSKEVETLKEKNEELNQDSIVVWDSQQIEEIDRLKNQNKELIEKIDKYKLKEQIEQDKKNEKSLKDKLKINLEKARHSKLKNIQIDLFSEHNEEVKDQYSTKNVLVMIKDSDLQKPVDYELNVKQIGSQYQTFEPEMDLKSYSNYNPIRKKKVGQSKIQVQTERSVPGSTNHNQKINQRESQISQTPRNQQFSFFDNPMAHRQKQNVVHDGRNSTPKNLPLGVIQTPRDSDRILKKQGTNLNNRVNNLNYCPLLSRR